MITRRYLSHWTGWSGWLVDIPVMGPTSLSTAAMFAMFVNQLTESNPVLLSPTVRRQEVSCSRKLAPRREGARRAITSSVAGPIWTHCHILPAFFLLSPELFNKTTHYSWMKDDERFKHFLRFYPLDGFFTKAASSNPTCRGKSRANCTVLLK